MNPYGPNPLTRSVYTGRAPRSLSEIGWSSTFDPEPGFWQRLLALFCGH